MIQQSYKPVTRYDASLPKEYTMKYHIRSLTIFLAALSLLLLCSCVHNNAQTEEQAPTTADLVARAAADPIPPEPAQLPVRYLNPGFVTIEDDKVDADLAKDAQEYQIKVGANIRSTRGPQPLWDILKRMAMLKDMSVSWSSDVDQTVLVDVDISATDNYFEAIDNLLRQVDYFHEVEGSTIIIKYKETKTYHVAMPFVRQVYETATGGNILGSSEEAADIDGTISLTSKGNEFDIWLNIELNLKAILDVWTTKAGTTGGTTAAISNAGVVVASDAAGTSEDRAILDLSATRMVSATGNKYIIDKPVGLITVHAPKPLQKIIESYFDTLKHELYKQVTIEAKIIEVQLTNNSTLGIDWNLLLRSLSFGGSLALTKDYTKNLGPDGTSTTRTDTSNFNRTKENSRTSSSNRSNTEDNTLTSDFTTGSTTDGTDGTITYKDGVLNHRGDAITGYKADSASGSSSIDKTTDSFSSVASAVTTAATIMTGGASNAAAGLLTLDSFNFADFLHALSDQGNTSILANPKLSVMNGQPALITAGKNITYVSNITQTQTGTGTNSDTSYSTETERVLSGVGLALTPVIKDDNEIILTLVPVTSVLEEMNFEIGPWGKIGLPIINVREMSTTVTVKDGEMLVIGGLITTVESTKGQNLFPGLANVPILKYLTGYETKVLEKRELIILLRTRII